MSLPSRCSGRVYVWRRTKEAYNLECLVPTVKHRGGSVMVWVAKFVSPMITHHGRIIAREHVDRLGNQVYPTLFTLLPNNGAVFQDDSVPFTQLELFSHGLKSMNVNFNIFPDQHNQQI
jgi:hypothetical protein